MTVEATGSKEIEQFHDWYTMTGYQSQVRIEWTKWAVRRRERIQCVRILVGSRIVSMGVSTAAMGLALVGARLVSYSDRSLFESDMRNAVGG